MGADGEVSFQNKNKRKHGRVITRNVQERQTVVFRVTENVLECSTARKLRDNGPLELLDASAHHERNVRVVETRVDRHLTCELRVDINERINPKIKKRKRKKGEKKRASERLCRGT